jgi:hypothetical protein
MSEYNPTAVDVYCREITNGFIFGVEFEDGNEIEIYFETEEEVNDFASNFADIILEEKDEP